MYFLVYSPIRAIEWGIMAFLIARRSIFVGVLTGEITLVIAALALGH